MASAQGQVGGSVPPRIGERFQVDATLGRGGMATVYRVTEVSTGRALALKALDVPENAANREDLVGLFEREFLTLAQLSHPRVIAVYDYGIEAKTPYYTMELLDGGDLRERAPLPWREACELLAGACSSLALIHSRRLVHRDVSPANVRCTGGGKAKLIDFGAMTTFGRAARVVGTPAFVAPEVVAGEALDGRADLYSFGATLYFALTGQPPYPARSFSQLLELWKSPPPPPSTLASDVPEALDSLVMSLLWRDPAMRPRAAFEVIQRLSAIANLEGLEADDVGQAYLSTPALVGRESAMALLRDKLGEAVAGKPGCVVVEGPGGVGRSRMVEAAAVEAKLLGATVLNAGATAGRAVGLGAAQALASQLLEALPTVAIESARSSGALPVLFSDAESQAPRLRPLTDADERRLPQQAALRNWISKVSESHAVVIAIDDANAIDEPSAAMVASLVSQARTERLFVVASVETGGPSNASPALEVLSRNATRVELGPLTPAQTESLLGSLFGDAQHLGLVSDRIHRAAAGNVGKSIDLARHLVERGVIAYDSGAWLLPVRLDEKDLTSAEHAVRERIVTLGPLARWLAEAQAAADDAFARSDYHALRPDAGTSVVDRALGELLSAQVLAARGNVYVLSRREWIEALLAGLDDRERQARHRALVPLYDGAMPLVAARHMLAGGEVDGALDRLTDLQKRLTEPSTAAAMARIPSAERATTIERALDAAVARGRPAREIADLRLWLLQLSVAADEAFYWRVAPKYLEQLRRDSGLMDWHDLKDIADRGQRLQQALGAAAKRYAAMPERDRVCPPKEAIQRLVYYVVASIAVGSRTLNAELMDSLPPLLEPFVPLAPIVDIIWNNATALTETNCRGQVDRGRARWTEVYEKLAKVSAAEIPYVGRLRNAVLFGIAAHDVRTGKKSSAEWTELLATDPSQHVNALYLRKVMALQVGDTVEAERLRKEAEVLALQTLDPQMFNATLPLELGAHVLSGDLTGIQQVMARMRPLAQKSTGWRAYTELAGGHFQRLRGDLEAACASFERCLALVSPGEGVRAAPLAIWPLAVAGYADTLVERRRYEDARALAEPALRTCGALGIDFLTHDVARVLALAEARLGDCQQAAARLDSIIAEKRQHGVAGLVVGAFHEARARVAIWASDDAAFATHASLVATEYRHGKGSALGARWERLMAEARVASHRARGGAAEARAVDRTGYRTAVGQLVSDRLASAETAEERARRIVMLLCDDRRIRTGHLYLVGETGLALAASYGQGPAPTGLLDFVRAYLEGALAEDSDKTAALSGTQMASLVTGGGRFRDGSGTEYRVVLLTCPGSSTLEHVGAVAFAEDGDAVTGGGAGLIATLADYLIRAGDVGTARALGAVREGS